MNKQTAKFLWKVTRTSLPNIKDEKALKPYYRKTKKIWNEMSVPERKKFRQMYNL